MTTAGRPRLSTKKRPGDTALDEILDAAAELFTTRGFTNTSTRMIADAVGMRQASLYHHFANKDELLSLLLSGTVDGPLAVAQRIADSDAAPAVKMYALALFDADQLCRSRWNLGALYLLPEIREPRFDTFRAHRHALMDRYASIAADVLRGTTAALPGTEELPFRLVETVVNGRADAESGRDASGEDYARVVAEAAVRVLGWSGSVDELHTEATPLLAHAADHLPDAPTR
ncbi:TetR/AcrR family transcriptional regulator [Rhodococcoides fascians]|uniref:TetR/AcrR family transcriptional regulator n=1 Tax=Rhodococcoides fascians TaxID=1828 RepID=UPI0005665DC0|nr:MULTISPECIES: TetR/AcrR family transcriptional regulator [Rhodococcus]OZF03674.1 TetR/AcrR family transcriptional regulator [Rhodococcus sp. 15-1189-1-1a]OZF17479.1 TetR/AcrR family transcriptional regulator [Rhodococcus sp. 14-2686-1-2]